MLIISGGLSIFLLPAREEALAQIQQEKAVAAAAVIRQFIEGIQTQIGWTTQLSLLPDAAGLEQRRIDYYRLLRQAPAITEIAFVDGAGKEQLHVSRLAMDVAGSTGGSLGSIRRSAARATRAPITAPSTSARRASPT